MRTIPTHVELCIMLCVWRQLLLPTAGRFNCRQSVVLFGPLSAHLKGEMPAVIGGPMLLDEVEQENAEQRIRKIGPGAELVRKRELERFDLSVKALRARASLADIVAFNRAVDWWHHSHGSSECATLVEALLAVLGVEIRVD